VSTNNSLAARLKRLGRMAKVDLRSLRTLTMEPWVRDAEYAERCVNVLCVCYGDGGMPRLACGATALLSEHPAGSASAAPVASAVARVLAVMTRAELADCLSTGLDAELAQMHEVRGARLDISLFRTAVIAALATVRT